MEQDHEVILAGFGGQGVLFAGLVLCHAGMSAGLNVAWIPCYGPEMRGGTANCTVIISSQEIGSPIVSQPSAAMVMNEPSLAKYGPRVRPGGTLVVNCSLARSIAARSNIRVVNIPASEIALQLGNERVANMVALGALVQTAGVLSLELVERALPEALGPGKEQLLAANREALRRGARMAELS